MVKLVVVGDSGAGKTRLVSRFACDDFRRDFFATSGIDFKVARICFDELWVKLMIWDTSGLRSFRLVVSMYLPGAQGILFVFDVTDEKSFFNLREWFNYIDTAMHQGGAATKPYKRVLVGCKRDLNKCREVKFESAMTLAAEYNMSYVEVSAKEDGASVDDAFMILVWDIMADITGR